MIFFNTEVSHEHIFFEDGKSPADIGYGPNGKFSGENASKYHKNDGGYDDCIMRKAADAVTWPGKDYCLFGHNCQSWTAAVRKKYKELAKDPKIKEECCKEKKR
ncbi:MAG: hypothetical protein IGR93_19535 [Hydrococcus sp. C42_A2020_068]|nr:hypothetical protein [Hydrococcus sp. C42_A2020_068]